MTNFFFSLVFFLSSLSGLNMAEEFFLADTILSIEKKLLILSGDSSFA